MINERYIVATARDLDPAAPTGELGLSTDLGTFHVKLGAQWVIVGDPRIMDILNRLNTLEVTSGTIVDIASGIFTGSVTTSTNNAAVKIFNATGNSYYFVAHDEEHNELFADGMDHGQTRVFHPQHIGNVTVTFTPVIPIDHIEDGHIVIESAGG